MKIAIIGGGVFGTMTAIKLAEGGASVSLFERLPDLMEGASFNANRLHQGFHYPRDEETARQCLRGFTKFREEFGAAILPGVTNAYFIASEGSLTSPADFVAFCRRIPLACRPIDLDTYRPTVRNVALGVSTDELMYDPMILRQLMSERLRSSGVSTHVGCEVADVRRNGHGGFEVATSRHGEASFDSVVNCCYADVHRVSAGLGHRLAAPQYEYAAIPVIELDWPTTVSITVLDGAFCSLLPFGNARRYLLYHVEHAVIARTRGPLLNREWLDPETSPFAPVDKQRWFETMLESCRRFIPALDAARLVGILQGPRMVVADREETDERPSMVTLHEPGYLSVFSGKVAHCVWVADEVASKLGCSAAG